MSKQEEIRKHINKYLTKQFICDPSHLPDDECLGEADAILTYLDSKDVVIRVECPDCEWSHFRDEIVGMTPCYSCNSTGYRIEPLLKEEVND